MVQTWGVGDASETTCKACGAVYERKIQRFPLRDKDTAECGVCGEEMESWNSTSVPIYRLIKRPDPSR